MTYEQFQDTIDSPRRRQACLKSDSGGRLGAIRAQQAQFDSGMAEINQLRHQLAEGDARVERALRNVRRRMT